MGVLEQLSGYHGPDKDGKITIKHVEDGTGKVALSFGGHEFAVCKLKDGKAVVQLVDCDTGVVAEKDIICLCWRR
jgi:hypothetical protein